MNADEKWDKKWKAKLEALPNDLNWGQLEMVIEATADRFDGQGRKADAYLMTNIVMQMRRLRKADRKKK